MSYTTITIEGGFFPSDLLDRIASNPQDVPGQSPKDFGLTGKRLTDEIQSLFSDAQSYWTAFRRRYERAKSGRNQSLTTATREGWLDPLLGGFGYKLVFQRTAAEAGGDNFAISHRAGDDPTAPPVHIVGYEEELDSRRAGRRSPHATVQEYLNRSDVLWGIVTNGRSLRLLRNSARLSKPTYLEFDLEDMIEGNVYSEFVLFYRLLHHTRLPHSVSDENDCILEQYYQDGIVQGGRVRERLRDGVEAALKTLGSAFITHPRSDALRAAITDGTLNASEYYRELLRLVYRMLFLMVAEERKLLFPDSREQQERRAVFLEHYGVGRLRFRAERRAFSDSEIDLWEGLKRTFRILREDRFATQFGMAALNGELFGQLGCPSIEGACCKNDLLLAAIDSLSRFDDDGTRRRVNFGALDVEELGSVYESLLEFHPEVATTPPAFDLVAGSERKITGSYYTPPELVHELIESALVPVIQERLASAKSKEHKESALLHMRVVDPAAGSGHFLLAAARRIGKELARIRTDEEEPAPSKFRHAVRDVIRHCIYAVDKNPLAVDLCKVALWIEGHNAGQPLSFLDAHVKCGDSLVGVFDLKVLKKGIPDDAYKAVGNDDKMVAREYKRRNKAVREDPPTLDLPVGPPPEIAQVFDKLAERDEVSPEDVKAKEDLYEEARAQGSSWWRLKNACDLWTAAFFAELKLPDYRGREMVPTTETVWEYWRHPNAIYAPLLALANKIGAEHPFFHWSLEFPDVFASGGFDVVLGNPPWKKIKLQEKEFFANRAPEIAQAANKAAREKLIRDLPRKRPELAKQFAGATHDAECQSNFVRESDRFPLSGRGDVNVYSMFAEVSLRLLCPSGRSGIVVPTGIATDDATKVFFQHIVEAEHIASLFDFENRKGIFPNVEGNKRFCLLTMCAYSSPRFVISAQLDHPSLLIDQGRRYVLSAEEIKLLNPNTMTCPMFASPRDADIVISIYRRVPVLIKEGTAGENPWSVHPSRMFDMTIDSHLFKTREQLEESGFKLVRNEFHRRDASFLPLLESKLVHQFNHRYASFDGVPAKERFQIHAGTKTSSVADLTDPDYIAIPRYWVASTEAASRIESRHRWFLTIRNAMSAVADSRSLVASLVPYCGIGNSLPIIYIEDPKRALNLLALLDSVVVDYVLRRKASGGNLNFFILKQLPVLDPTTLSNDCTWSTGTTVENWIAARVLELSFNSSGFAVLAVDLGSTSGPFRWDEERRFLIRCELDAAFLHLYGISRHDADYILDTFPIVKRRDEEEYGDYRTKRVILEIYDELTRAMETDNAYKTRLNPPPGDPRATHRPTGTKPITSDSSLSSE